MIKKAIIAAMTFFWTLDGLLASTAEQCLEDFFINIDPVASIDNTKNLISYLQILFEKKAVDDAGLSRFVSNLENGAVINPISNQQADVNGEALIYRDGLAQLLNQGRFDQEEILTWAKIYLHKRGQAKFKRKDTQGQTKQTYIEMKFVAVPEGRFLFSESVRKLNKVIGRIIPILVETDITLTNPLEAMAAPVTQYQWTKVMEDNPSEDSKGEYSVVVDIAGKSMQMQPNNPVGNITWWSAVSFANRISKIYGFEPVYDLTDVIWEPGTSAASGTLVPKEGKIKINAPGGNYYKAKGYRLPTAAEAEYIRKNALTPDGVHYSELEPDEMIKYVSLKDYSSRQLYPVDALVPLEVNGRKFYDLVGGVWEWLWDLRHNYMEPLSDLNVDPIGRSLISRPFELPDSNRGLSGGGLYDPSNESFGVNHFGYTSASTQRNNYGLRLVRTIHPEERY